MSKIKLLVFAFSLFMGSFIFVNYQESTDALPVCYDDVSRRNAAKTPGSSYPRTGLSRYESTCNNVSSTTQYMGVVSYYGDADGNPGATLHTPNQRLRIFSIGEPSSAVTIRVSPLTSGSRCTWTSSPDTVVSRISNSGGAPVAIGNIDNGTVIAPVEFNIATGFFSASDTMFGPNVWNWTSDLYITANIDTSVFCPVRVESLTAGIYVTPTEDASPTSPFTETQQKYNQDNADLGAGSKRILGPTGRGGPTTLYATVEAAVEYSIPLTIPCGITSAQNYRIRYYDPDNDNGTNPSEASQPNGAPGVAIYNDTTETLVTDRTITLGNDQYGEFSVSLDPAFKYSMVWYNVWGMNGLQIYLPFSDSTNIPGNECQNDPPPTCTLDNDIVSGGVELSWTSTDATSISINQGVGGVSPVAGGNRTVSLVYGRTYTATVTGPGGSDTCQTTAPDEPLDAPDISCPSYPSYASFTNPNVVINLSNAGKPANETVPSAPPPSSWTGSLIQDTRDDGGLTAVRQVRDTSTDNIVRTYGYSTELPIARLAPTIPNPVKDQYGQAPNYDATDAGDGTLKTDYTPFLDYPYDVHTAEATYQRKVFTRSNSYTYTRVRTYNYERATTSDPWIQVSAGNDGWSASRASFSDSSPYWGANATATATVEMPPCYPRDFSATLDNLNASLTTDRESPTGSSFSFTIFTTLSYSNGGSLRTATTVTALPYTVRWFTSGYNETAGSPSYSGSFSRTVNITNTSRSNNVIGSSGTLNETITVNIPPNSLPGAQAIIEAGQEICWVVEVGRPTGTVGIGGAILTSNTPAVSDDTCTAPAIDQPYSRFYGADVFAGGGFNGIDDTCSATDPDASLVGAMRGTGTSTNPFSGTGTQLAAFALGLITDVQPLSQSDRTPTQLAFANSGGATVSVGSRQFGGGFGSVVCANDYFADIPDSATWNSTTGNINVGNLSSGRHYYDGDVNIYGLVPEDLDVDGFGRRIVIYVDGDVSLRQNQTGDGTGRVGFVNNTDWPSIEAIPSLYIISNGNILIDDGVNEIDGVLIAQGGEIDTCSLGTTRLFTTSPDTTEATELSVNCRTQLRVNGAFLANKVNLLRTLGSLRESVPGEGPDATRAAETFIYNPTLWFTNGGELIPNKKMQIDSYTSLPPSL